MLETQQEGQHVLWVQRPGPKSECLHALQIMLLNSSSISRQATICIDIQFFINLKTHKQTILQQNSSSFLSVSIPTGFPCLPVLSDFLAIGALATSSQCFKHFTGLYLQVCKNSPIFKIIWGHKCWLTPQYHAFLLKNLTFQAKIGISILNLRQTCKYRPVKHWWHWLQ